MNEKNRLKILVGILCIVLLILVAVTALILDSQSPDPIFGIFQTEPTVSSEDIETPTEATENEQNSAGTTENTQNPAETTEDTQNPSESNDASLQEPGASDPTEEQLSPPDDLPPFVEIPTETDPETGKDLGIAFPCQIPGYNLTIEKMAPYSGMFVEDGSNANTANVAMLMVKNDGDFPVEYTQIRVMCGQEELLFDISALPVGERLVVQEKTGKSLTDSKATSASALVVQRAKIEMSEGKVKVFDNGDNTLTIQNLTNETIPTVRVFYKYYMQDEKLFVGGIAFTVRILRLGAGASVTIQPSHYTSQTSRVMMVLTYDSEV